MASAHRAGAPCRVSAAHSGVASSDLARLHRRMNFPAADLRLLFVMRCMRMFAYGLLGVVLVLYLSARGLEEARIGLLLTMTFLGDAAISLWLSTRADRWGRRRTLVVGAILMAAGGAVMAGTGDFTLLVLAATIGVISPSGHEVGPFLAVEQAKRGLRPAAS